MPPDRPIRVPSARAPSLKGGTLLKRCSRCGVEKPLSEFRRNSHSRDGFTASCKPCVREADKTYSARYRNSEKGKQVQGAWREERHDELLGYLRDWRKRPGKAERHNAYLAEYNRQPKAKEQRKVQGENRRVRLRGATLEPFGIEDWRAIVEAFDSRCAYCGLAAPSLEQDHFIPLRLGGVHGKANIVPACRSCNRKKNKTHPQKWCTPETFERLTAYLARFAGT